MGADYYESQRDLWRYIWGGRNYLKAKKKKERAAKEAKAKAAKTANSSNSTINEKKGDKPEWVPRTFTPEQDAIILEGRKNNKTNAEIADQLGQGIKKGEVGTRFNALTKGSGDAAQGGVVKKGEGQWTGGGKSGGGNGGGGGEGGYYHPRMQYDPRAIMPLVPDKDFDEVDLRYACDMLHHDRDTLPWRIQSSIFDATGKRIPLETIFDKFFEGAVGSK